MKNICERADATAEAAARYSRFCKLKLKVENITRMCLRGEASRARLAVLGSVNVEFVYDDVRTVFAQPSECALLHADELCRLPS